MSPCVRSLAFVLGTSLAYFGCGDDAPGEKSDSALDGAHADHEGHDAGAEEEEDVPCTADYPVFADIKPVKAGDLTVRLVSVSPEPPRQQTPNNWILEVVDAAGTPVSDVSIDNPDSYMPVHRHHGRTQPKAVAQSQPGRVQLAGIDFKMRGPWQVNFDVVAGGKPTLTTFQICVQ